MRSFFNEQGYLEVETPVLQPIPGGALTVIRFMGPTGMPMPTIPVVRSHACGLASFFATAHIARQT